MFIKFYTLHQHKIPYCTGERGYSRQYIHHFVTKPDYRTSSCKYYDLPMKVKAEARIIMNNWLAGPLVPHHTMGSGYHQNIESILLVLHATPHMIQILDKELDQEERNLKANKYNMLIFFANFFLVPYSIQSAMNSQTGNRFFETLLKLFSKFLN